MRWELFIHANVGISTLDLDPHFNFYHGDEEFGDLHPRCTSRHVNVLDLDNRERAALRIKTLLKLISGIRLIAGHDYIYPKSRLYFYDGNEIKHQIDSSPDDLDILLEELSDPFDRNFINEVYDPRDSKSRPSLYKDFLQIVIDDPIARENIILLSLAEENIINLLVYAYKIYENIKESMNVQVNNGKIQTVEGSNYPEELLASFGELVKYNQYINSKRASGLLSRHGEGNRPAPSKDKIPSIQDMKIIVHDVLFSWFNYQCSVRFRRKYRAPVRHLGKYTFSNEIFDKVFTEVKDILDGNESGGLRD